MESYDYTQRKGIHDISWDEFHALCMKLTEQIAREKIDIILGTARAGLHPAILISEMLRKEFFPIRLTRRQDDKVVYKDPVWKVDVPDEVKGKTVLVIDDIADTGVTLKKVKDRAMEKGATQVLTSALVAHSWANPKPDFSGLESDELIIYPWHHKTFVDDKWQIHPEIQEAIDLQKE
jgi:hypoxanthine phosphoribosyltransferase